MELYATTKRLTVYGTLDEYPSTLPIGILDSLGYICEQTSVEMLFNQLKIPDELLEEVFEREDDSSLGWTGCLKLDGKKD